MRLRINETAECHYVECPILLIVMLSVVMLNVIMLSVVMLSVAMLNVVALFGRPLALLTDIRLIFKNYQPQTL